MDFSPSAPALAFVLLFVAIALQLLPPFRWNERASLSLGALALVCAAGSLISLKAFPALLVAAVLLALPHRWQHAWARPVALCGIAGWALAAGFHLWPGFSSLHWSAEFGRHAQPVVWHFDKALAGLLLLLGLRTTAPRAAITLRTLALILAGALGISLLAMAVGLARPGPRWLPLAGVWLVGNLFITVVAEEAFFRGLLQGSLANCLAPRMRHGLLVAQLSVAALFGAVHAGWGWQFAVLAGVAGFFYGRAAGHPPRLAAAVLAHFLTNAMLLILMNSPLG